MPSTDELNSRLTIVENIIASATLLPESALHYQDSDVTPGRYVFGKDDPSIFGGDSFFGPCVNAPVAATGDMDAAKTNRW